MSDLPNWKKNKVAYNSDYNKANYSQILLMVPKETKARLQGQAKAAGMSLTAYILDCVNRAEK